MTNLEKYCKTNTNYIRKAPLYICDRCKLAFGHHVNYCPTCPGKMRRVEEISTKDLLEQLGSQGEWGETKAWDGEQRENHKNHSQEKKTQVKLPTRVIVWAWSKEDNLSSLENLYKKWYIWNHKVSGPEKTFEEDIYEYTFNFDSWSEALDAVWGQDEDKKSFGENIASRVKLELINKEKVN